MREAFIHTRVICKNKNITHVTPAEVSVSPRYQQHPCFPLHSLAFISSLSKSSAKLLMMIIYYASHLNFSSFFPIRDPKFIYSSQSVGDLLNTIDSIVSRLRYSLLSSVWSCPCNLSTNEK